MRCQKQNRGRNTQELCYPSSCFGMGSKKRSNNNKQPDDGLNSPQRTRTLSRKSEVHEVGGHAAEDQKQIRNPSV